MRRFRLYLIIILTSCLPIAGQQSQTREQREKILSPHVFKNAKTETLLYRLFIPQNYDRKKKYPLVLYLHGGGGRGNDNLKQIEGGNGYLIDFFTQAETQTRFPSFVVAPQSSVEQGWVEFNPVTPTRQLRLVTELIAELRQTYNIDGDRLYVAGQSLGGFGSFAIISEYPKLFAAGVPLCGGGDESKAASLAKTPIWAFHGEQDAAVPVERSRKIVAAIKQAGGQAKYTEYAGEGHNIWSKVVREPDLLSWLFAQRR